MKKTLTALAVLLILLAACPASRTDIPVGGNVYDSATFSPNLAPTVDDTFARNDSCTITLCDFFFRKPLNGDYLVYMIMRLEGPAAETDSIAVKKEIRVVFSDVIRKRDKPNTNFESSLSNKRLGSNLMLSGVDNVHLEVRLLKSSHDYKDFMETIKPIAGVALTSNPIFQVVDSLLTQQTTGPADMMLFSSDLYVPEHIDEYQTIKQKGRMALLQNNQPFAILLKGTFPVPDDSVLGKLTGFANSVTRFFADRDCIQPGEQKCDGVVRLYFTKDTIPVLPPDFQAKLDDLDGAVQNNSWDWNVVLEQAKQLQTETPPLLRSKKINDHVKWSIDQYLNLAKTLALSQSRPDGTEWPQAFANFRMAFESRGAGHGAKAVGLTGIYPSGKIAKVFLPYALPDNMRCAVSEWQIRLHQQFNAKGQFNYAIEPPPHP